MNALDWNAIYLTCFGVGLVMSVLSIVVGAGHLHIGHFQIGHTHVNLKTGSSHGGSVSPFNGFTLMAFLCWFGGSGYLLHRYSAFLGSVVFLLATVSGLAGASLLFWFLAGVLARHERTLQFADTDIIGVVGRLSTSLKPGSVGEMLYTQNGARRSAPVRSENRDAMERGTEVIVMRYARGIAYVRPWDEFEGGLMKRDGREEEETRMREP